MFEASHVEETGGDDLTGVNGGDSGHGEEYSPFAGDLNNEPDHAWGAGEAEEDNHIAHPPYLVTQRVKDGCASEFCHIDLGSSAVHVIRLRGF